MKMSDEKVVAQNLDLDLESQDQIQDCKRPVDQNDNKIENFEEEKDVSENQENEERETDGLRSTHESSNSDFETEIRNDEKTEMEKTRLQPSSDINSKDESSVNIESNEKYALESNLLSPSSTEDQTADSDLEKTNFEKLDESSSQEQQHKIICNEELASSARLGQESLQKSTEVLKERILENVPSNEDEDSCQTKVFTQQDLEDKIDSINSLHEYMQRSRTFFKGRGDVERKVEVVPYLQTSSVQSEIASEVDMASVMTDQDFETSEGKLDEDREQMTDPKFSQVIILL
jgi:hypothetical protein